MFIIFLIMLVFYFLPTIVGVATKRINSDTINYIKSGQVKENDSSIALLLNIVSVIFFFTPITFIAWIASFYFVIRNKKTRVEDIPKSQTQYKSNQPEELDNEVSYVDLEENESSEVNKSKEIYDINGTSNQTQIKDVFVSKVSRAKGEQEYKCVLAPIRVFVDSKSGFGSGVQSYSKIVDKEVVGGWKFFLIQPIPVTKKPGFFATLFGAREYSVFFNMLIFVREVQ